MQLYERGMDLKKWTRERPLCIVQFGAKTCMPCAAIRKKLEQWVSTRPAAEYVYVPIEEFPDVAAAESVFTVPTVQVLVQGRLTLRESGCFSLEEMMRRMQQYLDLLESER